MTISIAEIPDSTHSYLAPLNKMQQKAVDEQQLPISLENKASFFQKLQSKGLINSEYVTKINYKFPPLHKNTKQLVRDKVFANQSFNFQGINYDLSKGMLLQQALIAIKEEGILVIDKLEFVGGYAQYAFFSAENEVIDKISHFFQIKAPDGLLSATQLIPPDLDIKIFIKNKNNTHLKKNDFDYFHNKFLEVIYAEIFKKNPSCGSFKDIQPLIAEQFFYNPSNFLDLGFTRIKLIELRNSNVELVVTDVVQRKYVFWLDGIFFNLKDWIFDENADLQPEFYSECNGLQLVLDHLFELVRCENMHNLDFKAWFRLLTHLTRGKCSGAKGQEELLFKLVDTVLIKKNFTLFTNDLNDWMFNHHPHHALFTIGYLFNCAALLQNRLTSKKIEEIFDQFKIMPKRKNEEDIDFLSLLKLQIKHPQHHWIYQMAEMLQKQIPFELLYNFLSLSLFYQISRNIKQDKELSELIIDNHELNSPVFKYSIFNDREKISFQLKINPTDSIQKIVLWQNNNPQAWANIEMNLLNWFIKTLPCSKGEKICHNFLNLLPDFTKHYAQLQNDLAPLATHPSFLFNYLSALFDVKLLFISTIDFEKIHGGNSVLETKKKIIDLCFELCTTESINDGLCLWKTIPKEDQDTPLSFKHAAQLIVVAPNVCEQMFSAFKKGFCEDSSTTIKLIAQCVTKIEQELHQNHMQFCNIGLRLCSCFYEVLRMYPEQEIKKENREHLSVIIAQFSFLLVNQNKLSVFDRLTKLLFEGKILTQRDYLKLLFKLANNCTAIFKREILQRIDDVQEFPIEFQCIRDEIYLKELENKVKTKEIWSVITEFNLKKIFFYQNDFLLNLELFIIHNLIERKSFVEAIAQIKVCKSKNQHEYEGFLSILLGIKNEWVQQQIEELFCYLINKKLLSEVFAISNFHVLVNRNKLLNDNNSKPSIYLSEILTKFVEIIQNSVILESHHLIISSTIIAIFESDLKTKISKNSREKILNRLFTWLASQPLDTLSFQLILVAYESNIHLSSSAIAFWLKAFIFYLKSIRNNSLILITECKKIEMLFEFGDSKRLYANQDTLHLQLELTENLFEIMKATTISKKLNQMIKFVLSQTYEQAEFTELKQNLFYSYSKYLMDNKLSYDVLQLSINFYFQSTEHDRVLEIIKTIFYYLIEQNQILDLSDLLFKSDFFIKNFFPKLENVFQQFVSIILSKNAIEFRELQQKIIVKFIHIYHEYFVNVDQNYWIAIIKICLNHHPALLWNLVQYLKDNKWIHSQSELDYATLLAFQSLQATKNAMLLTLYKEDSYIDDFFQFHNSSDYFIAYSYFILGICEIVAQENDVNIKQNQLNIAFEAFKHIKSIYLKINKTYVLSLDEYTSVAEISNYQKNEQFLFCSKVNINEISFDELNLHLELHNILIRDKNDKNQDVIASIMVHLTYYLFLNHEEDVIEKHFNIGWFNEPLSLKTWLQTSKIVNLLADQKYKKYIQFLLKLLNTIDMYDKILVDHVKVINYLIEQILAASTNEGALLPTFSMLSSLSNAVEIVLSNHDFCKNVSLWKKFINAINTSFRDEQRTTIDCLILNKIIPVFEKNYDLIIKNSIREIDFHLLIIRYINLQLTIKHLGNSSVADLLEKSNQKLWLVVDYLSSSKDLIKCEEAYLWCMALIIEIGRRDIDFYEKFYEKFIKKLNNLKILPEMKFYLYEFTLNECLDLVTALTSNKYKHPSMHNILNLFKILTKHYQVFDKKKIIPVQFNVFMELACGMFEDSQDKYFIEEGLVLQSSYPYLNIENSSKNLALLIPSSKKCKVGSIKKQFDNLIPLITTHTASKPFKDALKLLIDNAEKLFIKKPHYFYFPYQFICNMLEKMVISDNPGIYLFQINQSVLVQIKFVTQEQKKSKIYLRYLLYRACILQLEKPIDGENYKIVYVSLINTLLQAIRQDIADSTFLIRSDLFLSLLKVLLPIFNKYSVFDEIKTFEFLTLIDKFRLTHVNTLTELECINGLYSDWQKILDNKLPIPKIVSIFDENADFEILDRIFAEFFPESLIDS